MHSLTIFGIVTIAIGTLVGTYCIQKGNQLKSKESSERQLSEITSLKSILNEQNATLVSQSATLTAQKSLLDEQLKIIREKELENFLANRNEYLLLVGKFGRIGRPMFNSFYSKDLFFKLTHQEILSIGDEVNEAIREIIACKFSSSSNRLTENRSTLSFDLPGLLYYLNFKDGDKIVSTTNDVTSIINVDKKFLDEQYGLLQSLLMENGNIQHDEIQKMTKEIYKKYGNEN